MRLLSIAGTCLLLTTPFMLPRAAESGRAAPPDPRVRLDPLQVCATGCSAAPLDPSGLGPEEYERLLAAFAVEPADERSAALETLLFHGTRTLDLIALRGLGDLDAERTRLLRGELERTHAWLDVRLVDEQGVERLRLGRRRIPLGNKQHLLPASTLGLEPPEISGTVQRVGLKHLWARL